MHKSLGTLLKLQISGVIILLLDQTEASSNLQNYGWGVITSLWL